MEIGELIFLLLFLLFPLLQRLGKKKPLPIPAEDGSGEVAAPSLQDALREISEALSGIPSQQKPAPQVPAPAPAQPQTAWKSPLSQAPTEFRPAGTTFADDRFEQIPAYDTFIPPHDAPHLGTPPLKPLRAKRRRSDVHRRRVLQQLNHPLRAREAFILAEILGPPLSKRKR